MVRMRITSENIDQPNSVLIMASGIFIIYYFSCMYFEIWKKTLGLILYRRNRAFLPTTFSSDYFYTRAHKFRHHIISKNVSNYPIDFFLIIINYFLF